MSIMSQDDGKILYLSFNQDLSCFSCGTETGFIIYDSNPSAVRFAQNFGQGCAIVEAMYKNNVVAVVGGGKHPIAPPNKCLIWDDAENKFISELEYNNCVTAVKMTRKVFAVATEDTIRLYDLKDKLSCLRKFKTGSNALGLCELSLSESVPILLTKTKKQGQTAILDYRDDTFVKKPKTLIECHKNALHKIRLNPDATKFATSGELGTLVRIFDTQAPFKQLGEVRRGSDYADIQNIYFSDDSKFLLITSNKSTLHIYSLTTEYKNSKSSVSFMSSMLPKFFSSEWSMAKVTVPSDKYIAGIVKHKDASNVYDVNVFMYNGNYQHYLFYPDQKQIKLKDEGKFFATEN